MAEDKHEVAHHDEGPHIETEIVPEKSPEDLMLCICAALAFLVLTYGASVWIQTPEAAAPAHGAHHEEAH